jgi:hypothetical protein
MTTSNATDALARLSALEQLHRDLAALYGLPADTEPGDLLGRAQGDDEALSKLLDAASAVQDSRLMAVAQEIKASTGRTITGEMRPLPKPGKESLTAAGFVLQGGR